MTWPSQAPHPTEAAYMAFYMVDGDVCTLPEGKHISIKEAQERFEQVHGHKAQYAVGPHRLHLRVGPIKDSRA